MPSACQAASSIAGGAARSATTNSANCAWVTGIRSMRNAGSVAEWRSASRSNQRSARAVSLPVVSRKLSYAVARSSGVEPAT